MLWDRRYRAYLCCTGEAVYLGTLSDYTHEVKARSDDLIIWLETGRV